MLIRFVIHTIDRASGRRRGVLHAAAELRESGHVSEQDHLRLRALADWFDDNLERPTTFAISTKPHAKGQAISWLRASATEHIRRMREISDILADYGVVAEAIRTKRPGYVVYEDEHQVTAYPFSDTPT